jgi:ABC-type Na+ efflux pump permease subunit
MTSFEFFTVLLSFVVSIGVAHLLQTVARLIQEHDRVRFSITWALWAAAIFNLQITFWLRSWVYHENYTLRTETSVPPLVLAIIAFLTCGLVSPRVRESGEIDLRAFHAEDGRKYQIAYAAFMIIAIIQGLLMADIAGETPDANQLLTDSIVLGVLAGLAIVAAICNRVRWIQVGVPAFFILFALNFYGRMMEQPPT